MSSDFGPRGTSGPSAAEGTPEGAGGADGASRPPSGSATGPAAAFGAGLVFDDPLDRPSPDDSDRGWGGPFTYAADDDFTRFLNEKPPHHL
jgi:hypothetical protein